MRGIAESVTERGFAVIGLGYVGLPVALALAKKFRAGLRLRHFPAPRRESFAPASTARARSRTRKLLSSPLKVTSDLSDIANASFFIVTVPTPIDAGKRPDLEPIMTACELIGSVLRPGAIVVFESPPSIPA